MIERRSFLVALGASGLALPLLGASANDTTDEPLDRALVLSGGGARGAYQAGFVGALAAVAGVNEGSPLLPYEMVCGTSIGALNGWFVATGQYTKLRDLWYGISSQNLMHAKPQYAALRDPESGILNRAAALVSLMDLTKNQTALLQSEPVYDWISRNIDPATPLRDAAGLRGDESHAPTARILLRTTAESRRRLTAKGRARATSVPRAAHRRARGYSRVIAPRDLRIGGPSARVRSGRDS